MEQRFPCSTRGLRLCNSAFLYLMNTPSKSSSCDDDQENLFDENRESLGVSGSSDKVREFMIAAAASGAGPECNKQIHHLAGGTPLCTAVL
jgi:hypothetical protein